MNLRPKQKKEALSPNPEPWDLAESRIRCQGLSYLCLTRVDLQTILKLTCWVYGTNMSTSERTSQRTACAARASPSSSVMFSLGLDHEMKAKPSAQTLGVVRREIQGNLIRNRQPPQDSHRALGIGLL